MEEMLYIFVHHFILNCAHTPWVFYFFLRFFLFRCPTIQLFFYITFYFNNFNLNIFGFIIIMIEGKQSNIMFWNEPRLGIQYPIHPSIEMCVYIKSQNSLRILSIIANRVRCFANSIEKMIRIYPLVDGILQTVPGFSIINNFHLKLSLNLHKF